MEHTAITHHRLKQQRHLVLQKVKRMPREERRREKTRRIEWDNRFRHALKVRRLSALGMAATFVLFASDAPYVLSGSSAVISIFAGLLAVASLGGLWFACSRWRDASWSLKLMRRGEPLEVPTALI